MRPKNFLLSYINLSVTGQNRDYLKFFKIIYVIQKQHIYKSESLTFSDVLIERKKFHRKSIHKKEDIFK